MLYAVCWRWCWWHGRRSQLQWGKGTLGSALFTSSSPRLVFSKRKSMRARKAYFLRLLLGAQTFEGQHKKGEYSAECSCHFQKHKVNPDFRRIWWSTSKTRLIGQKIIWKDRNDDRTVRNHCKWPGTSTHHTRLHWYRYIFSINLEEQLPLCNYVPPRKH